MVIAGDRHDVGDAGGFQPFPQRPVVAVGQRLGNSIGNSDGTGGCRSCRRGCCRRYRLGAMPLMLLSVMVPTTGGFGIWLHRPSS
jgi:hypothetical protein